MTTTNLGMTIPTIGGDLDIWGTELNADLALVDAFAGTLMGAAEVTIASAATVDIGSAASTAVAISGTTGVTSLGTVANCIRFVRYTGAVPITHNATTLILVGNASRTVASGDMSIFKSDASGNWREMVFTKGDGSGKFTALNCSSLTSIGGISGTTGNFSGAGSFGGGLSAPGAVFGSLAVTSSGADITGDSTFHNNLNVILDLAAQSLRSGNQVTANGFNVQNTLSWNGCATVPTGFPNACNFTITAHSNGVILLDGGTSWGAVSLLESKTDLVPLPGANPGHHAAVAALRGGAPAIPDGLAECPFEIINAHRVLMGRYKNRPESERRPFLIFEDAMAHFPQAAAHQDARIISDFERDGYGKLVLRPAMEADGITPKMRKDEDGNEIPVLESIPKECQVPASDVIFYDHYIPLIMAALQKQHRINQDLTARLSALEGAKV